jgi:hypothetical protein
MIHERKIAGVKHLAYEKEEDFKLNHPQETIQEDWKVAEEGQWCYELSLEWFVYQKTQS